MGLLVPSAPSIAHWSMWCSLEDFFIFWADTLLSPEAPVYLSHPWFLYNLTVQLQSSDFSSSCRFKLSCFNKHLLLFVFNENFSQSAVLFSFSPQLTVLSMCWCHSFMCLFTFCSSPYSCCFVSDYFSICQIKSNYFKVNITKIKITLFLLSLSELSVVLPSTLLPTLWKFGGVFLTVFHFAPSAFYMFYISMCYS